MGAICNLSCYINEIMIRVKFEKLPACYMYKCSLTHPFVVISCYRHFLSGLFQPFFGVISKIAFNFLSNLLDKNKRNYHSHKTFFIGDK